MQITSTFQARLKEGLRLRNMKASELSKKTGISQPLLSYYLHGERNPNANNIYDIARALNVHESWLMGYDVNPNGVETKLEDDELTIAKNTLKKKIDGIEDVEKVKQIDDFATFIIKK